MKGEINRDAKEGGRERDGTLPGKPQFISAEKRDFNPGGLDARAEGWTPI